MKVMKIIRKVWIYFLLKNTIAVYAGQSLDPNSRIEDHKGKKDFDDYIIVDFELEQGEMADVVEMDVIRTFNLKHNGLNEKLTHDQKWFRLREKYGEIIKTFYNAVKNKNFVYEVDVDVESILSPKFWKNEFDEYIINGLSVGLSFDEWYDKNKEKKPYTKHTFNQNTIELRQDYWKNEFEEFEKSKEYTKDWCAKRNYSIHMFSQNTHKFWDFNWKQEFEDYQASKLSEEEWCKPKLYSRRCFRDNTYEYIKKYWRNLFKKQQKSGLNPREFCEKEDILLNIFNRYIIQLGLINWEKELKNQQKSDSTVFEWCYGAGYSPESFNKYTGKFK